jgi:transcriptional regulator with XRE-family HTH domain
MNYSKAIRVARSLADLSQAQLADRAEIDRSYLSLIESGKRRPTVETIEKIAQALKMPFHLLSLLGSEASDVKNVNHGQIEGLSIALTKLLMRVDPDESKRSKVTETASQSGSIKKSARVRVPSRRKSRSATAFG